MSTNVIVTVPVRAARWITRVLRDAGMASAKLELALEDNNSQLELRLLTVNQLKMVSSELNTRTIRHYNDQLSSAQAQAMLFHPPKSGAKKATWITTIATYFHGQTFNTNLYNVLEGAARPTTSVGAAAAASAHARRPSPARGARKSPASRRKSPSKFARSASRKSPPKARAPTSTSVAAMAADEAIARALQNRYDQEDSMGNSTQTGINGSYQSWGGPLAHSSLQNGTIGNAAASFASGGSGNAAAGLKRPANYNDNAKPTHLPAKVKKEPAHHAATYHAAHSIAASAATASHATASASSTDDLQPRDLRESNMVRSLREMGFTDTNEILTALRAVAAGREGVEEHVEAAMMKIVSDREEAAEAKKMDEARISSEQADAAMEQSRKRDMERELKNSDLVDLLGSVEGDGSLEIRSRHFPCSVLLRNRSVSAVLKAIASGASLGKDQVIRLLSLEKKARKWYGTVLPFSYFEYVLGPRFGSWATDIAQEMCRKLVHECDELERVMCSLSEQEEGGVGSVPKVFLAAQRDATAKGKPTSEKEIGSDEDVQVLNPKSYKSVGMSSATDNGHSGKQLEVIEIE